MSDLIIFTQSDGAYQLAAFGENSLAEKTLSLSDAKLAKIWGKGFKYWNKKTEKQMGRQIDLGLAIAITLVAHFEGKVRPLARKNRLPVSRIPTVFQYDETRQAEQRDRLRSYALK